VPGLLRGLTFSRVAPISLFAAFCLAGNSWWTFQSISQLVEATIPVQRTAEIQLEVARIETDLVNAETGQRGYVLSASTDYLEPYYSGIRSADQRLAELRQLVAYDPALVSRLSELSIAVQAKFEEMRTVIGLMETRGQTSAGQAIAGGRGKALMDDVRKIISEIQDTVGAHLAGEKDAAAVARASALFALSVFIAGTLLLIILLYLNSRRDMIMRAKDSAEIAQYADSLKASLAELRRERNEIQELVEAAGYMQSCDSVPELTRLLTPIMERIYLGYGGHVYLHAPSRNRLDCVASFGGLKNAPMMAPTDCWSLRRGQDHLHTSENGAPTCLHHHDEQSDTLCVPLIAHGDTIGMLTLITKGEATGEVEEEAMENARRLSHMVGAQLALTFANLQLQDSLRQQAITDPLTRAFNRRYLDAIGDKIFAQADRFQQHLAVAMLDVDHFKQYNDLHGHVAGDHALTAVSQFMQTHIREADWLFRYGGEEFLIILQGSDASSADLKLNAMREALAALQFTNGDVALPGITVSLGCAFYPEHGTSLGELINLADNALYRAKASGRNRLCLHDADSSTGESAMASLLTTNAVEA
jgi:diguanylate cyclase (GGDEF)-like protein